MRRRAIKPDSEFERVMSLRKRDIDPSVPRRLTKWLRRRNATCTLRDNQAYVLEQMVECDGAVAAMQVGDGKSLITFLATTLLESRRSLLLVPASMEKDTRRHVAKFAEMGWHVRLPNILSYEMLGHRDHAGDLNRAEPDLVLCDECDALANHKAARTKRMWRYIMANEPKVAMLSATVLDEHASNYWHILAMALGDLSPWPVDKVTALEWSGALGDPKGSTGSTPGVLESIPGGIHQWTRTREGVVVSTTENCDKDIYARAWIPEIPDKVAECIDYVQSTNMRPDGIELDPFGVGRVLSELSCCGYFNVWDPMPPDWWNLPRTDWARRVRSIFEQVEGTEDGHCIVCQETPRRCRCEHGPLTAEMLDSPARVESAFSDDPYLREWQAVRRKFEPNSVPVWVDDGIIRQAADVDEGTTIWCRYVPAARRIAKLAGVPYCGQGADPLRHRGRTIVCGWSQVRGKNLQYDWNRARIVTPPVKAKTWNQLIGRFHRFGQTHDIDIEINQGTEYLENVVQRAIEKSRNLGDVNGFDSKLSIAHWLDPIRTRTRTPNTKGKR